VPTEPKPPTPPATAPIPFDDHTSELVRCKARQIRHRIGLPRTDLPDLEQDLAIHVWTRLGRYDPRRNPDRTAFVRMLVGHAAATVFRGRVRRTCQAPASLDALLRAARVPDAPTEPVDRRAGDQPERAHALTLDVAAVLASLPRPLRRVAEALKTRSVSDAARHLKLSRTTLYRRLAELREAFAAAGLEEFCAPRRTVRARPG
jgi:hypothetical protein